MKTCLLFFTAILMIPIFIFAESDLPKGMVLCEKDADCVSKGQYFKCLPQRYACGPSSTCSANACVQFGPVSKAREPKKPAARKPK